MRLEPAAGLVVEPATESLFSQGMLFAAAGYAISPLNTHNTFNDGLLWRPFPYGLRTLCFRFLARQ